MSQAEQERLIADETGWTLGAVHLDEPIQAFPLSLRLAHQVISERVALVGDAAHVVHPIAGQGLNLGLQDVACLVDEVVGAIRIGLDHGDQPTLERYQNARRTDTALMAVATDGLNRLFSNDIAPVRALRDFGLGLVDRVDPLKSALIRHAAAVKGSAPALMQGRLA